MKEIDYSAKLAMPEIFILKPSGYENIDGKSKQKMTTVAKLNEAYGIKNVIKLGNVNELEFKIPYFVEFNHKIIDNPHINLIKEKYIVKVSNRNEENYYSIDSYSDSADENTDYKIVKCLGTPIELQSIFLKSFNIDDTKGFSVREVLMGKSSETGIEERNGILRKTNWTVGKIDPEFDNITDTGLPFTVRSSTTILNTILLMAQFYKCTIGWDTKNRKINIHKPQSIGKDRGLTFSYGHYLKTLGRETKTDKMVTRLYVYGKDNLSIEMASPLGQNYIEDYSYFMFPFERDKNTKDVIRSSYYMTDELCHAMLDYTDLIDNSKEDLKNQTNEWEEALNTLSDLKIDMYHSEQELIRAQDKHYIYYSIRNSDNGFSSTGRPYTQKEYDAFTEEMGGGELWDNVVAARTNYEHTAQMVKSQEVIVEQRRIIVDNLRNELSEQANFSTELLKEKIDFTIEKEFRDGDQVNPYRLYEKGVEEFKVLQFPQKTIRMDIINFLDCIEEQWSWDKLNLSDIVTIRHETLGVNVKARIIEIDFDYENGNISLVIAVTDNLEDEYATMADLINRLISSSIQVEQTIPIWEELQDKSDYVSSIIEKFYDDVADQINLAVNQSVIINEFGITVYEMLNEENKDEDNFLRITNGALGITNDGGKTYKNAITTEGIIAERVIGKLIMGHNLIMGDPDGMLEILGNKGTVRDRCLDPRTNSSTYLRGREVMRFGLYNYDTHGVDDYRNPHVDQSQDRFGIQLFGSFSDSLTVNNDNPIIGNANGIPGLYNAQPLSRVTMDSNEGFFIDKWENIGEGYDWHKKFYVDVEGSLFAEDMTTYGLKILQKPGVLLLDSENRFMNIGRMSKMVLDGALTPLEKIQVKLEWARIEQEFVELHKAYLEHRYTYRGGDRYGNKSNIDHLNTPSSPAWEGTEFANYPVGFWNSFQQKYNSLNKYLNVDTIILPNHPDYPQGSLLGSPRSHITEREDDIDDNGKILELGTGFNRSVFTGVFTDYYEITKVLVDAINTLIRWASTELGKFYNDVRMDAEDGIVVTRKDNENQIWMSAVDGFSISKNKSSLPFSYYSFLEYSKPGAEVNGSRAMQNWQKVFYVDTGGNLNMLGSLDMLSLNNQTRVLIDQNSPEDIPFAIMGRHRSVGMQGDIRPGERYNDHTGEWWRKLYIDTEGNLFANDLTANRLILRDADGDVVLDANSGFFDLNKFALLGNIMADNIVTGTILADVGHVADLTVNRLKSLDLTAENKVANYVDIENQYIRWITAKIEQTTTQRTKMALDRETEELEMLPLYWTDSSRSSTTTYPEDFPNATPVYEQRIVDPAVKMELGFNEREGDFNNIPKIIMGTGTGNGDRGKGFIYKDYVSGSDQGLVIEYVDMQGEKKIMRMDDNGISLSANGSKIILKNDGQLKLEHDSGSFIGFAGGDININATGKVNIKGTEIHLNA